MVRTKVCWRAVDSRKRPHYIRRKRNSTKFEALSYEAVYGRKGVYGPFSSVGAAKTFLKNYDAIPVSAWRKGTCPVQYKWRAMEKLMRGR